MIIAPFLVCLFCLSLLNALFVIRLLTIWIIFLFCPHLNLLIGIRNHSTETALVKFLNDLLLASDSNELTFTVLLDLSSAFDTIDHSILFARLYRRFGFRSTVLSWLESFLTDRYACVRIKSSFSNFSNISCGVPQGSVLGPLLFQLYVAPIFRTSSLITA